MAPLTRPGAVSRKLPPPSFLKPYPFCLAFRSCRHAARLSFVTEGGGGSLPVTSPFAFFASHVPQPAA